MNKSPYPAKRTRERRQETGPDADKTFCEQFVHDIITASTDAFVVPSNMAAKYKDLPSTISFYFLQNSVIPIQEFEDEYLSQFRCSTDGHFPGVRSRFKKHIESRLNGRMDVYERANREVISNLHKILGTLSTGEKFKYFKIYAWLYVRGKSPEEDAKFLLENLQKFLMNKKPHNSTCAYFYLGVEGEDSIEGSPRVILALNMLVATYLPVTQNYLQTHVT